mgnify:CR=1 FL=1
MPSNHERLRIWSSQADCVFCLCRGSVPALDLRSASTDRRMTGEGSDSLSFSSSQISLVSSEMVILRLLGSLGLGRGLRESVSNAGLFFGRDVTVYVGPVGARASNGVLSSTDLSFACSAAAPWRPGVASSMSNGASGSSRACACRRPRPGSSADCGIGTCPGCLVETGDMGSSSFSSSLQLKQTTPASSTTVPNAIRPAWRFDSRSLWWK